MGNKLPQLRCPLKFQGLMSNQAFVGKMLTEGGQYLTATIEQRPDLIKCDRDKCGFYSSFTEKYDEPRLDGDGNELLDENGDAITDERTRVIEGCAIALLPQQIRDVSDALAEAGDDASEAAAEMNANVEKIGSLVIGGLGIAANKFGMADEFKALAEATQAEDGDDEPDDDGDEPEEDEAQ